MANVLYYSMTGNTRKMADAIAAELGAGAINIQASNGLPGDGVLFLGSGSYGDKPGEGMEKFIAGHDFSGRSVALFGTSGRGEGKEVQAMAEALKQKGATVIGSYYSKGKAFVVVNRGHPDAGDLEGARKFAREMAKLG